MFDEGAAHERFMGRWSERLAPLLVRFAGIRGGDLLLDVGSGTGALAFALADAASSSRIVGVDRSAAYVASAQARAATKRVQFVQGDAQQLQVADGAVDGALALLVMNFFPDPAKALREMIRVSRPGGVVAAAVWDYGDGMQMLRLFWDEAVARDPAVSARDERQMPLSRRGELGAIWRTHGLEQVEEQPLTIQLPFSSFDDYWSPFLGGQGPAGGYVAALSDAERSSLELRLRQRLLDQDHDRAFTLQARAWAVKGVVPPR